MKNSKILLVKFCFLLSYSIIWESAEAQTITESLQKNIWQNTAPTHGATWESMLPSSGQDTIVYSDLDVAEVVTLDSLGRPIAVCRLQMIDGQWVLETKTAAKFHANGFLIALLSWKWEENHWENESQAIRFMDQNRNDFGFQLQYWEDGGWQTAYSAMQEIATATSSAQLEP